MNVETSPQQSLDGFAALGALLAHPDPRVRVAAMHRLSSEARVLERRVVLDAHASGLTWAEIGCEYGVSRQAVHRRFVGRMQGEAGHGCASPVGSRGGS